MLRLSVFIGWMHGSPAPSWRELWRSGSGKSQNFLALRLNSVFTKQLQHFKVQGQIKKSISQPLSLGNCYWEALLWPLAEIDCFTHSRRFMVVAARSTQVGEHLKWANNCSRDLLGICEITKVQEFFKVNLLRKEDKNMLPFLWSDLPLAYTRAGPLRSLWA